MVKRIGLIGVGRWGRNHARILHEKGVLHCVADIDESARQYAAVLFPHAAIAESVQDALDADCDGYIVATPSDTHFEIAAFLLLNGKSVLVEKPLAMKVAEVMELRKLSLTSGARVMVGHILLFHPAVRRMKEILREGRIGVLRYMYSHRLGIKRNPCTDNVLWNFAPHDLSIFHYFMEAQPESVCTSGPVPLPGSAPQTALLQLKYSGNISGHIFVSQNHPFRERRVTLIGTEGLLTYDEASGDRRITFFASEHLSDGAAPISSGELFPVGTEEPLDEEIEYFISRLPAGPIEIGGVDGALEITGILEAAETGLLRGCGYENQVG